MRQNDPTTLRRQPRAKSQREIFAQFDRIFRAHFLDGHYSRQDPRALQLLDHTRSIVFQMVANINRYAATPGIITPEGLPLTSSGDLVGDGPRTYHVADYIWSTPWPAEARQGQAPPRQSRPVSSPYDLGEKSQVFKKNAKPAV